MLQKVEIAPKSIVIAILLVLGFIIIYQVRDILFGLFISLILVTALDPIVEKIEKLKISRPLAIFLVYILVITISAVLVTAIASPLIDQSKKLLTLLPSSISQIEFLNSHQEEITSQILNQLGSFPENVLHIIVSVFSNIFSVFTTLVITFYFLLERKYLDKHLSSLFGSNAEFISKTVNQIEYRIGSWVRGELILMLTVGVAAYIGLELFGVDSALPLAIIAGVLEILPNIGPVISAIPAVLIAASINPIIALGTIVLYTLIQLCENHFLVPRVMQKTVGVNPIIVIISLLVGNRLAGPAGAILAIPAFVIIQTITATLTSK